MLGVMWKREESWNGGGRGGLMLRVEMANDIGFKLVCDSESESILKS